MKKEVFLVLRKKKSGGGRFALIGKKLGMSSQSRQGGSEDVSRQPTLKRSLHSHWEALVLLLSSSRVLVSLCSLTFFTWISFVKYTKLNWIGVFQFVLNILAFTFTTTSNSCAISSFCSINSEKSHSLVIKNFLKFFLKMFHAKNIEKEWNRT